MAEIKIETGKCNMIAQSLPNDAEQVPADLLRHFATTLDSQKILSVKDIVYKSPEATELTPSMHTYYSNSAEFDEELCSYIEARIIPDVPLHFSSSNLRELLTQVLNNLKGNKIDVYDLVINEDENGQRVTVYYVTMN